MNKRMVEQGAAALIVVIFSVLLLITVSLGFMRLVATDQQRTINDELSRGAYDAAIAGVEDGKRVLQACIGNGDVNACQAIADTDDRCRTVQKSTILSANPAFADAPEVLIQNSTGISGGFDQAYTCVRIERNTHDLEGSLTNDSSRIIPLATVDPFTDIIVSWYQRPVGSTVDLPGGVITDTPLPAASAWTPPGRVRPPILRVQLIQFQNGNFTLDQFDQSGGGNTIYLYPKSAGLNQYDFASDGRSSGANQLLKAVQCNASVLAGQFVCSARLVLPNPPDLGGSLGTPSNRQAYLRLTAIYGETDYTVRAVDTQFHDVSPAIDATGRASDVFRRVRARVERVSTQDQSLYPRATVDITRNFCKDFSVSADAYVAGSCQFNQP
ncbi:MAG: hypothetical protein ACM3KF_00625 [Acidobacteriota bacterium]